MPLPWEDYQTQKADRLPWQDFQPAASDASTNQPPGVPMFVPPGVEGYDPQTGEVSAPPMQSSAPRLTSSLMGAIEGLPLVGPYAKAGVEDAAASIASLGSGVPYKQAKDEIGQMVDSSVTAHPNYNTGGQVIGGAAGTVPLILAAPTFFGAGPSASLIDRILAGGLSGMALGGADAGVRGGTDAIVPGAALGLGLGAVAPGVGALIGKGVGALASRLGSGVSAADRSFARAAGSDAVSDMAPRLNAMGPDAMPMDLGPNLRQQAGAQAATPGRGQAIIRSAIGDRDAVANARIRGAIDNTIGTAPDMQAIKAGIAANKEALGPEYEAAFSKARAVDTTPIANDLESQIVNLRGDAQKAAQSVRKMLNVTGTDVLDPNPYTLFQTRQAIDGMLKTEANPKVIGILSETRKKIDNRLAASVPGIKNVDAKFAELSRQEAALERGQQILDSGRTAPRPNELATEFQTGAAPQGKMTGPSAVPLRLSQGARAEIDRIVGTNANDRVALQKIIKGEGDWNRDRLATIFGPDKADRLINVLDRERAFADTSSVVTRNSESASRIAGMVDAAPPKQPGFIRSALNLRFGDTAADLGDKVIGGVKSASQEANNAELAKLLTSTDPAMVTRKIQMVQAAQRRGDISAQKAKEIIQSFAIGPVRRSDPPRILGQALRQPLEITVRPNR